MATAPLKKCSAAGCKQLIRDGSRCERHRKERTRQDDRSRGNANQRGYTYRWQQYSKWFLSQPENALCRECEKQGKIKASECVDHIVPPKGDEELFWDERNHQPLCIVCNSRKGDR